MKTSDRLFTGEFLAINGIAFLTFCNMAVFFQFYLYLQTLPIASEWHGFLIALFSVTGLIVRPLASPFLHPGNARKWMLASVVGVVVSLLCYRLATGFWGMFMVRAVHGITYVILGVALNARLVELIPPSQSGRAFGLVTVITLLPFAVIPPILDTATRMLGGFVSVLDFSALFMVLIFPLSLAVKTSPGAARASAKPPGFDLIVKNLKDRRVLTLLLLMLLLYSSYTPVFFFLQGYAVNNGIANPGLFLTLSTVSEIGVRLAAGKLFDRFNKVYLVAGSLAAIGLGYLALAHVAGAAMFYGVGLFLGFGWGVAMPVLNALLFDISPPELRGFNTNLGVQMFQAGFFIGPLLGGLILTGMGFPMVYYTCAILAFGGVVCTPLLKADKQMEKTA
jgi:MFS family permease